MEYSKQSCKVVGIKHLVLGHVGQENYQTNVYLYILYYVFHLNIFNEPD
jgi:fucose 4-O-acetylase-like acetyltransferase